MRDKFLMSKLDVLDRRTAIIEKLMNCEFMEIVKTGVDCVDLT